MLSIRSFKDLAGKHAVDLTQARRARMEEIKVEWSTISLIPSTVKMVISKQTGHDLHEDDTHELWPASTPYRWTT